MELSVYSIFRIFRQHPNPCKALVNMSANFKVKSHHSERHWNVQQVCYSGCVKHLNGLSPERSTQFSNCHRHEKSTRGSNSAITLPLNRTELGKQTFAFQGGKLFDKLPKEVRDEGSLALFKHKLHFISFLLRRVALQHKLIFKGPSN